MLAQFLLNGFASGCQSAIFALAFWLFYISARFVDVSQAGLFVVSGYGYFTLTQIGMPPVLAVFGTMAIGALIGLASDITVFRPLSRRSASMPVLLLTSLALYEIFVNATAIAYGNSTQMLSSATPPVWTFGPVLLSQSQGLQILTATAVTAIWVWVFLRTRLGLYIRSAAEEPSLFVSFGLNLTFMRTISFCAANALVALVACTSVIDTGINPDRGMPALLDALAAVLLGGSTSAFGPVLGALVLGLLKAIISWKLSERWEQAMTFAVLVVLLIVRPGGLRTLIGRSV